MLDFAFWQKWFRVVGMIILVFGVLMVLFGGTALFDVFNRQIDPVFWGVHGPDEASRSFRQWVYGVWGSTIAGWGVTITWIADQAFKRRERWAWNGLLYGILVWYVLDTAVSAASGVYFNAFFNTGLLLLVGLPLAFTRIDFQR